MNIENKDFMKSIINRRSYYSICNNSDTSENEIEELLKGILKHSPTAFNSQSGRIVVLFGEQHLKLWDIVKGELKKISKDEQAFAETESKINHSFQSGFGTVLFFEDQSVVKQLQESFPSYADAFPSYSLQSSGMLQILAWTALENEGFGASLQHYGNLIEDLVAKEWNIDKNWSLISQMPFGKVVDMPNEKTFLSLDDRLKVFV